MCLAYYSFNSDHQFLCLTSGSSGGDMYFGDDRLALVREASLRGGRKRGDVHGLTRTGRALARFGPSSPAFCFDQERKSMAPSPATPYGGVSPNAPTPFTAAGELDPSGMRRDVSAMKAGAKVD